MIVNFKGKEKDTYEKVMKECINFVRENTVSIIEIQSSKEESDLAVVKMAIVTYFLNKYMPQDELWMANDMLGHYSKSLLNIIKGIEDRATVNYEKFLDEKIVQLPKKGEEI